LVATKGFRVPPSPSALLPDVIALAEQAGRAVAAEFCRPDGPRFSDHVTAPVDREIELFLRDRLTALLPARFVGEEAGILEAEPNGFCWVVDPHDGTRAFLEGRRGSAVSIALLRQGEPVLGVVYAPSSPDRGPDMIAWAEGTGITRNGQPVSIDLRRRGLGTDDVVFLNHGAWQRPVWHGTACAPTGETAGRFMPLPSIAYRLARVAVGDGIATLTLRPVNALDIVAGHALLMAAGGVLLAEDGAPVTYSEAGGSRPSACFGGAPDAVATLRARTWRGSTEPRRENRVRLDWPRAAEGVALDRAIGAMLGMLIGDSRNAGPDGRLAGQPGPAGEGALAFARGLLGGDGGVAGGLLRMIPLGIWAIDPRAAAAADAARTGADPAACATIAAAVAAGLAGASETEVMRLAGGPPADTALAGALRGAALGRQAFSPLEALAVLTCRPDERLGAPQPRPEADWADDLIDLAEALLLRRTAKEPA
jgi:fructose-1,6-bisphosphatase/inositol monophosphatase family enzyme